MDIVWWDVVLSYVRNESNLCCLAAVQCLPYLINAKLTFLQPGPLDACEDSASTIMLFEYHAPEGPDDGGPIISARSFVAAYDPVYHFGKMNVCFADGHVKPCAPHDLVKGTPCGRSSGNAAGGLRRAPGKWTSVCDPPP